MTGIQPERLDSVSLSPRGDDIPFYVAPAMQYSLSMSSATWRSREVKVKMRPNSRRNRFAEMSLVRVLTVLGVLLLLGALLLLLGPGESATEKKIPDIQGPVLAAESPPVWCTGLSFPLILTSEPREKEDDPV